MVLFKTQHNGLHLLSHTPSESWGGRALFNPKTYSLHLARLTPQDAGIYTCRVVGSQDSVNETFHIRGEQCNSPNDSEQASAFLETDSLGCVFQGPMKIPEMRVVSKSLDAIINATAQSIGPLREDESVDFFCEADPCKSKKEADSLRFAVYFLFRNFS